MVGSAVRDRTQQTKAGKGLEELYLTHAPAMVGFAFLLTGDRQQAEDLVQDAFVRVAGKLRTIREPEAFPAYLRRTVVNLHMSSLRRTKLEREHISREAQTLEREPAVDAPDLTDRDELRRALHLLPARQRTAIVLRYYADLTERQAAAELDCSESALRSLVMRGMETLRSHLGGER